MKKPKPLQNIFARNRLVIELLGVLIIALLVYLQRDILPNAFALIKTAPTNLLLICFGLWWITLLLSALNYKILASPKKLKYPRIVAVHLSGAGPGRLIPGGLGHMSVGTLYLRKAGFKLENAITIATTNNFIGFLANMLLLLLVIPFNPSTASRLASSLSTHKLGVIFLLIAGFLALVLSIIQIKKVSSFAKSIKIKLLAFWTVLLKHPRKFTKVLVVAGVMTIVHATIIRFSVEAVGLDIGWFDSIFVLSAGVAFGAILPTPGGVGAVEAGLTSALIIFGIPPAEAAGAAIIYRIATFWQPLIPGIISYGILRRRNIL